jgi:hypothetical protein
MTPFSEPQHGAQALNEEAGELIVPDRENVEAK